jgi:hypothetical protein
MRNPFQGHWGNNRHGRNELGGMLGPDSTEDCTHAHLRARGVVRHNDSATVRVTGWMGRSVQGTLVAQGVELCGLLFENRGHTQLELLDKRAQIQVSSGIHGPDSPVRMLWSPPGVDVHHVEFST